MTATAPPSLWWRRRLITRRGGVLVEFRPPSIDTLLRAQRHPRGDRFLARAIITIHAPAPLRWLVRATSGRALRSYTAAAIRAAMPARDDAAGDAGVVDRRDISALDAARADIHYIADLCAAYGWTPSEARALTPREALALYHAARWRAEADYQRRAALQGVQLPNPPPLPLDARDAKRAAATDRARARPKPHIDIAGLDELFGMAMQSAARH